MVIFVTVGTGDFDELIKTVDELVGEGKIKEKVIMHIARGKYIPKNCEYFRFAKSLKSYRENADLIIGHGGLATILESIIAHKIYIGVANTSPDYPDNHQNEILEKMSEENYILWCRELHTLYDCILKAKKFEFMKYISQSTEIPQKINEYIKKNANNDNKKILVILGEGGHTFHMVRLVEMLGDKYTYDYMILKRDKISQNMITKEGKIFKVTLPRKLKSGIIMALYQNVRCFVETLRILIKSKPYVILSGGGGGGITLLAFLLGKLIGKKTIFLEDMCRVYSKSMSGKIIEKFNLADLFFVQWGSMKKLYPNAIYVGRLF